MRGRRNLTKQMSRLNREEEESSRDGVSPTSTPLQEAVLKSDRAIVVGRSDFPIAEAPSRSHPPVPPGSGEINIYFDSRLGIAQRERCADSKSKRSMVVELLSLTRVANAPIAHKNSKLYVIRANGLDCLSDWTSKKKK